VTLNIDTKRALRTGDELRRLAEAVRDAPAGEPETDSVEWKGPWDLTETKTKFQTAKHVLGFGNRTVVAAARVFEGCAYLLAGVEPGSVIGTAVIDPAQLDDYLSKYVLPGQPRWHPSYVEVDGKQVLILTVEAPREGDPICALQKAFDDAKAGRVFVRRGGKTVEAEPAEIRALEARLRSERPKVELAVERADAAPLKAVFWPADTPERFAAREKARLLAPLAPPPAPKPANPLLGGIMPRYDMSSTLLGSLDSRSKDEFKAEVDAYVADAEALVRAVVGERAVQSGLAVLRLVVTNPTERNFEAVQAEITVPPRVLATLKLNEVRRVLGVPDTPIAWGKSSIAAVATRNIATTALNLPQNRIERTERTTFYFPAGDVRPGTPAPLPEIHLLIPSDLEHLSVLWRLTSTSADSWREGEITLDVDKDLKEPQLKLDKNS